MQSSSHSPQTILITGASSGIGLALAKEFAAAGDRLVLVARREDRLKELAEQLNQEHGTESVVLPFDLVPPGSPIELVQELDRREISVDVVVNNAGFGALGRVSEVDADRQADMIRLNILSLFELTRRLLPGMLERGRGGVLNVASMAGFLPGPNMSVYYATKAFVLHFSEGLAQEIKGRGVKVSCLCPGPTKTEFGQASGMDNAKFFKASSMSVERVAREGHRGFLKNKAIVIPGVGNRFGIFMVRFAPRSMVRALVQKLQRPGDAG